MAIDTWLTVTQNPNASKIGDNEDHKNKTGQSTANAGDMTLAYDSAKFTSLSLLKSAVNSVLKLAACKLPQ